MLVNEIFSFLSVLAAFAAVFVSFYSIRVARKTAINGVYFSEMSKAYSDYLKCISEFVYHLGLSERDALSASLYRVLLFAPLDIASEAQDLYAFVLQWASSNPNHPISVDQRTSRLGQLMRNQLLSACRSGKP